jgi:type II secretory pathway pseudopilin PulG
VRIRLRNEDGVALPVAIAMMVVISLLVTAFFTVALQLQDTTVNDRSQKRALAAAEAGLQTAVQRLNQINNPPVPSNKCLTTVAVFPDVGTGECPPAPVEQMGDGSSFTYYVTPELGTTGTCVTLPTVTPSPTDRCVTGVGTSGDVTRRLQARVARQTGSLGYTQVGVVGKELVYTWNSDELHSDVGSNTEVHFGNATKLFADPSIGVEGAVKLLDGATYTQGSSVSVPGGIDTVTTPYSMPQVDFEAVQDVGVSNNNNVLPSSYYDATTRRFSMSSGSYTMPPGTYHFCKVTLGNSVNLRFSGSALTKIYVDSPARPGSPCNHAGATTEDGTFGADNSVSIGEVAGHEELLEIYLYGSMNESTRPRYQWCDILTSPAKPDECQSDFMLDNSVKFWGTVYAPNSTVQAHNSVEWYGAVGANKIRFYNSIKFYLTDAVKNKPSGSQGAAVRRGWAECRAQPATGTDPESGC